MAGLANLEFFLDRFNISLRLTKVPQGEMASANTYKVQLWKADRNVSLFLAIPAEAGDISLTDAITMLMLDASGCEDMRPYYFDRQKIGAFFPKDDLVAREMNEFWREYESRCQQIEKLKVFLGPEVLQELAMHFRNSAKNHA